MKNWREIYEDDHLLYVDTDRSTPVNITVRVEKGLRSGKWEEPTINVSSTSGSQPIEVAEAIQLLMQEARGLAQTLKIRAMAKEANVKL